MIKSVINEGLLNTIKKSKKYLNPAIIGTIGLTGIALGSDMTARDLAIHKINNDRDLETKHLTGGHKDQVDLQKDAEIEKTKMLHNKSLFKKTIAGGGLGLGLYAIKKSIDAAGKSDIRMKPDKEPEKKEEKKPEQTNSQTVQPTQP
jgi:hypothetical protein